MIDTETADARDTWLTLPTDVKLDMITECERIFGQFPAAELWDYLGLPIMPSMERRRTAG